MKVWKVITDLTVEENDLLDELFSEEDANKIREMDENSDIFSWDFINGKTYIPYLICTEPVMEVICDICDRYSISFGPIDITEEFLLGLHDIPDSDFVKYREENLTEDLVYKKIKKFGGSSLDKLDKYVLENC